MQQVTRFLTPLSEPSHALMRIYFGLLFSFHGAQKLFGLFGGSRAEESLMMVAGVIEFFGGLAIALGLFAQLVALVAAAEMLVAYFMAHFPNGLWPIENRGELALLYLFGFLVIMSRGAGKWSLDGLFFKPDDN